MVHTRENVRMTVMIMLSVMLWNISPSADAAAVMIRNSTATYRKLPQSVPKKTAFSIAATSVPRKTTTASGRNLPR